MCLLPLNRCSCGRKTVENFLLRHPHNFELRGKMTMLCLSLILLFNLHSVLSGPQVLLACRGKTRESRKLVARRNEGNGFEIDCIRPSKRKCRKLKLFYNQNSVSLPGEKTHL